MYSILVQILFSTDDLDFQSVNTAAAEARRQRQRAFRKADRRCIRQYDARAKRHKTDVRHERNSAEYYIPIGEGLACAS